MGAFLDGLRELRQGLALDELDDALVNAVAGCRSTGKAARVTLTITVKPAAKGNVDALVLEDDVAVKLPKPERGTTILYATAENGLSRKDPRQPELQGLREVVPMPARNAGDKVVQG
jgi:hypothetical protein